MGRGRPWPASASPSFLILPALDGPALEHALDVLPATTIVDYRLAKCRLDPRGGVEPLRLGQLLRDQRRQQPDVLLVQRVDPRPIGRRPSRRHLGDLLT